MREWFTFCGVNIEDLGLHYAPELQDTYVYAPAETEMHFETFEGHDGGYFYGTSRQPKEFTLRCYFEEKVIDRGIMDRVNNFFKAGKSGKLVFSRRPWCYYYATVISTPRPDLSNYLNGQITISMKASYPFARSDQMFSKFTTQDASGNFEYGSAKHNMIMANTAMVDNEYMVPPMSFSNPTKNTPIILHNPGTEFAPLSIMIAGDAGMGVVIKNKTTNQECKIVAMDKNHTSNVSKMVYIDGMNGNTSVISTNDSEKPKPGFVYHDYGFIQLAPAYPCLRNIFIENISSNLVTLVNTLRENVEGQYIYIGNGQNGGWHRIEEQISEQYIRIDASVSADNTNATIITKMNELEIEPIDTMDITHLSFLYKPTFA